MKSTAKRVAVEGLGWVLVVLGIAALVLPGPGLLALFAGVALLATQYEWAERQLEPVKVKALQAASDSVRTWPRIVVSGVGVLWLIALGAYWSTDPPVPGWWPLRDGWWLPGGLATGISLIVSGLIAGALLVYSYRHFRELDVDRTRRGAEAPANSA